jgi:hypothetical protein
MIKQEIRSLVRNTLPKIDKSNRYHDVYIDAVIEKAIANLYEEVWRMNPVNLQRYVKQYGYAVPIVVNVEAVTGVRYSTLPESIVPFQDKGSGVRRISTALQGALKFIPMDAREQDLLANGAFFNSASTLIGYGVNQTRIEYYGMSAAIQATGVRMDLIIPFSKYAETDEVKIPEIADTRTGETFIDKVMKILGVVQAVDLKDDNSPQEGKQKDN